MDNTNLDRLLAEDRPRQYWLKAVGPPTDHENYSRPVTQQFGDDTLDTHFSGRAFHPEEIDEGDIFVSYWTGVRRLIYVAECYGEIRTITEEVRERQQRSGGRDWRYIRLGRNLTPQYGREWFDHHINPWVLGRLHFPAEYQRVRGAIRHGISRISVEYARLLIRQIRDLPCQTLVLATQ